MFETTENYNDNNSSLKEEALQKINEIIINIIQEKPKIIDGWTRGRWIDYIKNTLSKYTIYDISKLNISLYEKLTDSLGTNPTESHYNFDIDMYYVYDNKNNKWSFISEKEKNKAIKKREITEIINTSIETENHKFTNWNLAQWKEHIKSMVEETPDNLSEIIKECLGIQPIEAQLVKSINLYYVYDKKKEYWSFLNEEKYSEICQYFM